MTQAGFLIPKADSFHHDEASTKSSALAGITSNTSDHALTSKVSAFSHTLAQFASVSKPQSIGSSGHSNVVPDEWLNPANSAFTFGARVVESDGTLIIRGSKSADQVVVRQEDDFLIVSINGRERRYDLLDSYHSIHFTGRAGDDLFVNGTALRVQAWGQSGNDRLVGGISTNRFWGGSGDDLLSGGNGGDFLNGGSGADRLLGMGGNDRLIGGLANDQLFGGGGDDLLIGGKGLDLVSGGAQSDILRGGADADTFVGGAGADRVRVNRLVDSVTQSSYQDRIQDLASRKVRLALNARPDSSHDTSVKAAPDNVSVITSRLDAGKLVVRGTINADVINIRLSGGNLLVNSKSFSAAAVQEIVVDASSGNDMITIEDSVIKRSIIFSGVGDDTIQGGGAIDEVYGGHGNDSIKGGRGADILVGGSGTDILDGESGTDKELQDFIVRTRVSSNLENQIIAETNKRRAAAGLAALKVDTKLTRGARTHSLNMSSRVTAAGLVEGFGHSLWGVRQPTMTTRFDYVGYDWNSVRENIAEGFTSAVSVVNAWMNSPGHRANILATDVTEIGVSVVRLSTGQLVFTQNFGRD
jgi:uncharacterized protein YkwD